MLENEFENQEKIDRFIDSYINLNELSKKILESETRSVCEYLESFELGLKEYLSFPKKLRDCLQSPIKLPKNIIERIVNYKD